jgi:hypothetical protein
MKPLLVALILLTLAACIKERTRNDPFSTYIYAETYCSDPWERGATDSLTLRNLSTYLTTHRIDFRTVGIQKTDAPEVCNACSCKTGNRLSVTFLMLNDSTVSKMQQLGFNRLDLE